MSYTSEAAQVVIKYVGRAVAGPVELARGAAIATLATAQVILDLLDCRLAADVGQFKRQLLRKHKARTDAAVAAAKEKLARAAVAANEARDKKHQAAMRAAELRHKEAEAAKSEAEAAEVRLRVERGRAEAIASGRDRLIAALGQLRMNGGEAFFSAESLKDMLPTSPEANPAAPGTSEATVGPDPSLERLAEADEVRKFMLGGGTVIVVDDPAHGRLATLRGSVPRAHVPLRQFDRWVAHGWLAATAGAGGYYALTAKGEAAFRRDDWGADDPIT